MVNEQILLTDCQPQERGNLWTATVEMVPDDLDGLTIGDRVLFSKDDAHTCERGMVIHVSEVLAITG